MSLLADGRLYGTGDDYAGVFAFDPHTDQTTILGPRAGLAPYTQIVCGDKLYSSGYSNGPLFVYEPARPWTLSKGGPPGHPATDQADARSNPRYLGDFDRSTRVGLMHSSALGADGKVYFGGFGLRHYTGGGFGWYDSKTQKMDGFWKPLSGYAVQWIAPALDGRLIVISTTRAADELNENQPPEEAKLFVYDVNQRKIVRQIVPIAKARATGLITEVAPGRLLGLTTDGEHRERSILYGVDVTTGEVLFTKALPLPVSIDAYWPHWVDASYEYHAFVRGPDGFVWTYLKDVLVRIDPQEAGVQVVGKVDPPGWPTFVGRDIYLAGSEQLRRIRNVVPVTSQQPSEDPAAGDRRVRKSIDRKWIFWKGDAVGAEQRDFDDRDWHVVGLPHDWTVEGPVRETNPRYNGFLPRGIGWYRKYLTLDNGLSDRQIYLEFDGIFRNSTLWVNGRKVGSHVSGYTGVVYDITPYIHCDGKANVLAVRVDGRNGEGWWYEGCGIYRHVWLIATDKLHVANWGTFVTTPQVSQATATVRVRTTVQNDTASEQPCLVTTAIADAQGRSVAHARSKGTIAPKSSTDLSGEVVVDRPHLWMPDSPYLYRARSELIASGKTVDTYETPFGIRSFEFTADKGFFLNGRHLQLRGMCIHHDFGGLGVALPDRANEKTVEVMKQMGCNFLRSAHNDAAPSLLEACDRLGILVWLETRYLGPVDSAGPPLRALIRRSRNHPSVICWSLANTAGGDDAADKNVDTKYLKALNQLAHEEDPTRPTAFACEGDGDANANGFGFITDIMGYNGGGMRKDDRDHQLFPQRKMLISEFSSGRGTRGVYQDKVLARATTETMGDGRKVVQAGQYFSTYALCRAHEREWSHIASRPWLAGGAMWSGFDYEGENSGWPMVTSQFGVLDVCRFPNDAYYYYLQEWTTTPMVHVFPHWTWPGREGKPIDVWCYSNCDAVELLLSGKSLGVKPRQSLGHIAWTVPYQPGTLEARALKGGNVVCTRVVKTAGDPARISLSADRTSIRADGCDLSFVTLGIEDGHGNPNPIAQNEISVEVEGRGRLLGLASGDPASHENPRHHQMKAFNGLLLAIVQSDGKPGPITLKASSAGLRSAAIALDAREP